MIPCIIKARLTKMLGEEVAKIASDIKVASDNEITVKNSLVHNELHFEGIEKAIALFFPSIRKEFLLRMRAETIDKVCNEAYMMAINGNIPIKPIPNKIAVPLIEKMSLEHEPDMYKKWANLLLATGINADPIHQQYAEVLSNLNSKSANLLKLIYTQQPKSSMDEEYYKYIETTRFQENYNQLQNHVAAKATVFIQGQPVLPKIIGLLNTSFSFPLVISGGEENKTTNSMVIAPNENNTAVETCNLALSKEDKNMLIGLKNLDLIEYNYITYENIKNNGEKQINIERCGVLLTKFGYSFVDCLENPTK